jgi:hypothetical protein
MNRELSLMTIKQVTVKTENLWSSLREDLFIRLLFLLHLFLLE